MNKLKPKLFSVMKTYNKNQLFKDIIAGIIVAIIALPLSIALAIASGVSPEQGLYTAIFAGFFISFLEKYMHASDLIVTKPGGLTVSEALACNLPMAVFNAIPGQEEDNANFLKANDMGVKIDKNTDFPKFISNLIKEKHQLDAMRKSCEKFDKSDSSKNIVELMKKLIKENI